MEIQYKIHLCIAILNIICMLICIKYYYKTKKNYEQLESDLFELKNPKKFSEFDIVEYENNRGNTKYLITDICRSTIHWIYELSELGNPNNKIWSYDNGLKKSKMQFK